MRDVAPLLVARIKRVFADVPRPDARITSLRPEEDFESEQITREFEGVHWSGLTTEILQRQSAAMAFFSPDAFRFFLPGYLLLALKDPIGMDVSLNAMLSALAPPSHEERLAPMTREQLLVTLAVLETITPPEDEDVEHWEFERAKDGVLDLLTRPSSGGEGTRGPVTTE
jgi:hypothetical protein